MFLDNNGQVVALDTDFYNWTSGLSETIHHAADTNTWMTRNTVSIRPDDVWRNQRAVRTVVGFIANIVAGVSLGSFNWQQNDSPDRDYRSPLAQLLLKPNDHDTPFSFMRALVIDIAMWGRYCATITYLGNGQYSIERVPPRLWIFLKNQFDQPTHMRTVRGIDGFQDFPLAGMLWFDGYPDRDHTSTPMSGLEDLLNEQFQSAQYRTQLWKNGARPASIIERPVDAPPWTPDQRDYFRDSIRTFVNTGARAGGTGLLEEGMRWRDIKAITPTDAQQIEAQKQAISEVAAYFHIPPVFVGLLDNANYSNVGAYREQLYSDTLGSWFTNISQGFNCRALPVMGVDSEMFTRFLVEDKLRVELDKMVDTLIKAVGTPVMTRNEGRLWLGLPKIDGPEGDEIVTPIYIEDPEDKSRMIQVIRP